jgi:asparagine synthase (glutamine-hydrolysing)
MCGLVGILGPGSREPGLIHQLSQTLAHRGPDGEGWWIEPLANLALGHRRLSIIDLSTEGAQPMMSADGRWVLVFNGEIYNHAQIRAELDQLVFHSWRGHSDTETLVEAIACWGVEEALHRCNGMFAIACWDAVSHQVIMARDRLGEKPLYAGHVGRDLVFASELKAFRCHPEWTHRTEPRAVSWLSEFGYIPAPWSIHKGIYKIPAGALLRLNARDHRRLSSVDDFLGHLALWWNLDELVERARHSPWEGGLDSAVSVAGALVDDAVKLRMCADVKVGALLSGGIDSTLVACSMATQSLHPVSTFTVAFGEAGYDESTPAAETARRLGTDHRHIRLDPRLAMEVIADLPVVYDEPFADTAQLGAILVAKAARQHVTVALTGDGGDEVFHGYQRYLDADRNWNLLERIPAPARRGIATTSGLLGRIWPFTQSAQRLVRQGHRIGANQMEDYGRALMRFDGAQAGDLRSDPAWHTPPPSHNTWGIGEYLRWRDQKLTLPEGIHTKLDRASMAVGMELRVPLLDPRLLELAWRLPPSWHIQGRLGKRILRKVLGDRGYIEAAAGRKRGFDIPIAEWLRGPLREWAQALLESTALRQDPNIDGRRVTALWRAHQTCRADYGHALWAVLMYLAWSARYA